jgi:hypothetical protein
MTGKKARHFIIAYVKIWWTLQRKWGIAIVNAVMEHGWKLNFSVVAAENKYHFKHYVNQLWPLLFVILSGSYVLSLCSFLICMH